MLSLLQFLTFSSKGIPVRKEWFATLEQLLEEVFPILEGIWLCVGANHLHPKLCGGERCKLHSRCCSSLMILPKYACLRFGDFFKFLAFTFLIYWWEVIFLFLIIHLKSWLLNPPVPTEFCLKYIEYWLWEW